MKLQALALIGLLCTSAFALITNTDTVQLSGITYGVGKDGNNCGVTRTESGTTIQWAYTSGLANADDCVPEAIVAIGSNIWVVIQVSSLGGAALLVAANSASGGTTEYTYVIPSGSEVDGTVAIGRIVLSSVQNTFGKFASAIQYASQNSAGTWGSFDITDVTTCSNTIQVEGDTQSTSFFLVDESGTRTTVSGNGVFSAYATGTGALDGYTTSNKPCSGVVLSVASAIVSLVAMFF